MAQSTARGQSLAPTLRWRLGPVLFNIFINYPHDGTECTLSKVADNTKLEGVADTPDSGTATQRDPDKLEKRAMRNIMKFNKGKCSIQLLGRITTSTSTYCGPTGWKAA